ncbi:orotate phosphoribosyltransferase [Catenulispora sp. MAP12-49]
MLTAMPSGTKGVAIAVLVTAALSTAACGGGSAKKAAPPPSPATATTPTTATAPSTTTSSAAAAGGLSAAQLGKLLLTGQDDAGFTYDASQDGSSVTSIQDVVTTGGSACQAFVDAQEALSTKYGTTAEVDRQLTKANDDSHVVESSVMAFPSAAKASAMVSDLTASLTGCKNLAVNQDGTAVTMAPSVIPELVKDGQVGYVDDMTAAGHTELLAADLVRVGTVVSVVAFLGPVTNDPAALQQMGGVQLAHLSDVQVARLKAAQGSS